MFYYYLPNMDIQSWSEWSSGAGGALFSKYFRIGLHGKYF